MVFEPVNNTTENAIRAHALFGCDMIFGLLSVNPKHKE